MGSLSKREVVSVRDYWIIFRDAGLVTVARGKITCEVNFFLL